MKIQLQSIGTAIANSLMYFIHAAAFGYGSVLVENGEINPVYVFRLVKILECSMYLINSFLEYFRSLRSVQ